MPIDLRKPAHKPLQLPDLSWKGRSFARKVQVWGFPSGVARYLFSVHREEAYQLCVAGTVAPEKDGKGRIECVELRLTPGPAHKTATHITLHSYSGTPTIFRERLGPPDAFAGHKTWTPRKAATLVLPA